MKRYLNFLLLMSLSLDSLLAQNSKDLSAPPTSSFSREENMLIGGGAIGAGVLGGIVVISRGRQIVLQRKVNLHARALNRAIMFRSAQRECALAIRRVNNMTAPRGSQNFKYGGKNASGGGGEHSNGEDYRRGHYDFSPKFLNQAKSLAQQLFIASDTERDAIYNNFMTLFHAENERYYKFLKVPKDLRPELNFTADGYEARMSAQIKALEARFEIWNKKLKANKSFFIRHSLDGRDINKLVSVTAFGLVVIIGGQMVVLGYNEEENDVRSALEDIAKTAGSGIRDPKKFAKETWELLGEIKNDLTNSVQHFMQPQRARSEIQTPPSKTSPNITKESVPEEKVVEPPAIPTPPPPPPVVIPEEPKDTAPPPIPEIDPNFIRKRKGN